MNILDIRTVLFSYVITNLICLVVMISLWMQERKYSTGLNFWLVDFSLQFIGVLLVALRGIIPDSISIFFGTPLILIGTLFLYQGIERYLGKVSSQFINFILLGLLIIIHVFFSFFQPNLVARNINFSVGVLVICTQLAWLMLVRVKNGTQPGAGVVGVVFVIYSVVSILRIFADLVVPPGNDLFHSGLYDTLVILVY
jgi:hypothetical protein